MADQYAQYRDDIDGILCDVGKLLGDLVEAPRAEVNEANALIDGHLQQFFKAYYELKSRHDDAALSVAVMALTKSGKSTLLNALLGAECLPVNNVPETARICKIIHTPAGRNEQPTMQEGDVVHTGEVAIRQRLQEINSEVRAREHVQSDEQILHIFAPLSALDSMSGPADHTKLYLLDTPGPNEAGEEGLRYQVERLLDSVDAVIYLLDYTKLKTAEEAAVLGRLKGANPTLVRRLCRRLFFAVNKVDQVQQSEGLDEDETREYVADLITRQLACDGFHLMPEQVMLVSARDALLSRLVLTNRASEMAHGLFLRNAFGRRGAAKVRPAEEIADAAVEMLAGSGLPELEERVLRFLYTQGGGVKMLATADDIARLLQEVENIAVTTEAALAGGVEGLAARAEDLRGDLQGVLQRLEDVLGQTAALHSEITGEIRTHLEALRTRLFRHIMEALDAHPMPASAPSAEASTSAAASTPAAAAAAAATARAEAAAAAVPASQPAHAGGPAGGGGRWAQVRQRFSVLFGGGGAGGAPGAGARTYNKEQLLVALEQLHEDVIKQINSEVREFWGGLEAVCNARNASLVAEVNGHLADLVARVEGAVEQRLDVRLQAVSLKLPQPTSEQFHSDLQDLIGRGVEERQERHVRVGQKEFVQKELRMRGGGLCRWGAYWVTAPVTKTFVETYTSTVYQLQPSEVMRHFIELVDSAVDSSEQVLASYVHRYLHLQLHDARRQIQEYGDRYISVVTSALDAGYQDSDAREAALAVVRARLEGVRALEGRVGALQGGLVDFVPPAGGCSGYEEVDYLSYLSDNEAEPTEPPAPAPPALDTPPSPFATNDPPPTALAPVTTIEPPPTVSPPLEDPLPIPSPDASPFPTARGTEPTPPPMTPFALLDTPIAFQDTPLSPSPIPDPTATPFPTPDLAPLPPASPTPPRSPVALKETPPSSPTAHPPPSTPRSPPASTHTSPTPSLYSAHSSSSSDLVHLSSAHIAGAKPLPPSPPRSPSPPALPLVPTTNLDPYPRAVNSPRPADIPDLDDVQVPHPQQTPPPQRAHVHVPRPTSPSVPTTVQFLDEIPYAPRPSRLRDTPPTPTIHVLPPARPQPPADPNVLEMSPLPTQGAPPLLPFTFPGASQYIPPIDAPPFPVPPLPAHGYAEMMLLPPAATSPAPLPPFTVPSLDLPQQPFSSTPSFPPAAPPLSPTPFATPVFQISPEGQSSSPPSGLSSPPPNPEPTATAPTQQLPTSSAAAAPLAADWPDAGGSPPRGGGEDDVDVSDYANICVLTEEIPDPPFDYHKGFAEVMSSGALSSNHQGPESPTPLGPDDSDDWTMVEDLEDPPSEPTC